jgi:hypothetical protein
MSFNFVLERYRDDKKFKPVNLCALEVYFYLSHTRPHSFGDPSASSAVKASK